MLVQVDGKALSEKQESVTCHHGETTGTAKDLMRNVSSFTHSQTNDSNHHVETGMFSTSNGSDVTTENGDTGTELGVVSDDNSNCQQQVEVKVKVAAAESLTWPSAHCRSSTDDDVVDLSALETPGDHSAALTAAVCSGDAFHYVSNVDKKMQLTDDAVRRGQRRQEDGIRDFCLSRGLGDVYKRPEFTQ